MSESEYYSTQGGGVCKWDSASKRYYWISVPEWMDFTVRMGDFVPDDWGIAGPIPHDSPMVALFEEMKTRE